MARLKLHSAKKRYTRRAQSHRRFSQTPFLYREHSEMGSYVNICVCRYIKNRNAIRFYMRAYATTRRIVPPAPAGTTKLVSNPIIFCVCAKCAIFKTAQCNNRGAPGKKWMVNSPFLYVNVYSAVFF